MPETYRPYFLLCSIAMIVARSDTGMTVIIGPGEDAPYPGGIRRIVMSYN